ncbi:hypothetical protein WJX72_003656 [[Myrmecia] bisecta]|uniref:EF-hand domain-containing protein n=1 Tax=[Myrmecia] bisecta TaxID=41462 RepID=A0AAW1QQ22_9CHLO
METPRDTSQIPALSPMARWRQAVASQVLPQAEVNKARSKARLMILQSAMRDWLKKRGHPVPPGKLNPQQKQEIRECFELLDEDGSGALDADELYKAFKMLGMRVTKKSIEKMMNSIDADGTGEIEFDEFQSMMAKTLTSDNSTEAEADGSGTTMMPAGSSLPFQEVARAVRRKKLLDDVMAGGEERLRVMHTFEQMLQDMQGYDAHTVLALRHGHEAASAMTSTALSQSSGKCFEQRPLRVGSLAKTLSLTASHVAALAAETAAADAVTSSRMALPPAVSTFASQRRQLLRSFNSRKLGRSKSGSGLSSFGSGLEIGMPSEAQDQNMEREVAIGLLISQKLGTSHAVPAPRQFKWEVEDGRERAQKWVNEVDEAKIAEGLDRLKSEQSSGKQRSAGMRLLQAGLAGTPAELSDVPPHIAAAQGPAALADSAGDSAAASLKPTIPRLNLQRALAGQRGLPYREASTAR